MMGPMTYVLHLASTPRLPFTAAYFGSIFLTLYFSLGVSTSEPMFWIIKGPLLIDMNIPAPKHILDITLFDHPDRLLGLVPD